MTNEKNNKLGTWRQKLKEFCCVYIFCFDVHLFKRRHFRPIAISLYYKKNHINFLYRTRIKLIYKTQFLQDYYELMERLFGSTIKDQWRVCHYKPVINILIIFFGFPCIKAVISVSLLDFLVVLFNCQALSTVGYSFQVLDMHE